MYAPSQLTAGKKITEQDVEIAAQDLKIAAQDAKIAELSAKLVQQDINTKTAKQCAFAEQDAGNRRNASCSAKSTILPQVVDISNYTPGKHRKLELLLQLDPNYVIAGHTVAETQKIVESKLHNLEVAELRAAVLPPITTWKQLEAKLERQYRDRKTAEQDASRSPIDKSTTLPQVVDITNWTLSELKELHYTIKKDPNYVIADHSVDQTIEILESKILELYAKASILTHVLDYFEARGPFYDN